MGNNGRQSYGQEHGHGKIHEKGISTENFKFFRIAIISSPDLGKIPKDKNGWNTRKNEKPIGDVAKTPDDLYEGKSSQYG